MLSHHFQLLHFVVGSFMVGIQLNAPKEVSAQKLRYRFVISMMEFPNVHQNGIDQRIKQLQIIN